MMSGLRKKSLLGFVMQKGLGLPKCNDTPEGVRNRFYGGHTGILPRNVGQNKENPSLTCGKWLCMMILFGNSMICLSQFHAIAGIETRITTCGGPTTHEKITVVIKTRDFVHGSNMVTKQCTNVLSVHVGFVVFLPLLPIMSVNTPVIQ